jgi:hypothetical protein
MENRIVSYERNKAGVPVGCILARCFPELNNNTVYIAWSLCRKKDNFSKRDALEMAEDRARAMAFKGRLCAVPRSLATAAYDMVYRAQEFFPGKLVMNPVIQVIPPKD